MERHADAGTALRDTWLQGTVMGHTALLFKSFWGDYNRIDFYCAALSNVHVLAQCASWRPEGSSCTLMRNEGHWVHSKLKRGPKLYHTQTIAVLSLYIPYRKGKCKLRTHYFNKSPHSTAHAKICSAKYIFPNTVFNFNAKDQTIVECFAFQVCTNVNIIGTSEFV